MQVSVSDVEEAIFLKPDLEHEPWTQCKSQSDDQPLSFRDERSPVELRAYVIRSDKKIVDVMVVDLSYDGCAVRTSRGVRPRREGQAFRPWSRSRERSGALV